MDNNSVKVGLDPTAQIPQTTEIKAKIDEACRLVEMVQTKQAERGERVKELDESMQKMADASAKIVNEIQDLRDQVQMETKAREDLEAAIARKRASATGQNGEEILSTPEYTKAFNDYITRKSNSHAAFDRETTINEIQRIVDYYLPHSSKDHTDYLVKTMAAGSKPDGGVFLSLDDIRLTVQRVYEASPVDRYATTLTTTSQGVPILISDVAPTTAKRSEYQAPSATDTPQFDKLVIVAHELSAYPAATVEIVEDPSVDVASILSQQVGDEMGRESNVWRVIGNNVDESQGFMTLDTWADPNVYERWKLGAYTTASANEFSFGDFVDLQSGLLEPYQSRAAWWMNRLSWAKVISLTDDYGRPLLNPQLFFSGTVPQILGQPVIFAPDMDRPSNGTFDSGDRPVFYGNMSRLYTIVNRLGITAMFEDMVTSPGYVKWWFRMKTGGAVTDFQAGKYMIIQ
jgi:HK97 family phage major capsid protein